MCLDLNDTHLGNRESRELGLAWEGTAGPGTLGAPMRPLLLLGGAFWVPPWASREQRKKEWRERSAYKTALENRGGPGRAIQAKETVGKLRCKGHFLASATPAPSEVGWLLRLSTRVR